MVHSAVVLYIPLPVFINFFPLYPTVWAASSFQHCFIITVHDFKTDKQTGGVSEMPKMSVSVFWKVRHTADTLAEFLKELHKIHVRLSSDFYDLKNSVLDNVHSSLKTSTEIINVGLKPSQRWHAGRHNKMSYVGVLVLYFSVVLDFCFLKTFNYLECSHAGFATIIGIFSHDIFSAFLPSLYLRQSSFQSSQELT